VYELLIWDFDGTLIPFDSEQYLLSSLSLARLRALGARLFVYADRHGWDPRGLKILYAWCLRGVGLDVLGRACAEIAGGIVEADRVAIRDLASRGLEMRVVSCGTTDLSWGALHAAGLSDCFSQVEANPFTMDHAGRIAGIERRVILPETKVKIVARSGVPWEQVVAVGDGLTDLPLLDRAGLAILIAGGRKAARHAGREYQVVPTLSDAIELIASYL
jgi:phosphoserine phosphatase